MAEFVGIDPAGARRLVSSMGDAVQRAQTLRPSLSASIAEAGADWPAGPGAEVLDNVGRFLDRARQDLTWRMQTIERIEGAVSRDGVKTAEFAFGNAAAAQTAGALAGRQTLAAWQDYQKDPSVKNWEKVQATLQDSRGKTVDAAYSAGLLATLGTGAFAGIFGAVSARNQNDPRGYSPANLGKAKKDLGSLAEAFASADSAGTIPKALREQALNELPIGDMAALFGMARQSRGFLVQAGAKLAQYGGHQEDEEDWNTYWLVKALSQNGEATQELLASGDNAALLLRPEVVNDEGRPEFKQLLATALDKALAPGVGSSNLRRGAWINVIKVFSDKAAWPSLLPEPDESTFQPVGNGIIGRGLPNGKWMTTPVPSPIGQVLAKHVTQYFPELAAIWNRENDVLDTTSIAGWQGLNADKIAHFFGGLLRDPAALPPLRAGYEDFVRSADLGAEHPFGSSSSDVVREEQRAFFLEKAGSVAGAASLLVGGLSEADLDAEESRKFLTELFFFPADFLVGKWTGTLYGGTALAESPLVGAGMGKGVDLLGKNALQDMVEDIWDGAPPEEASALTKSLLDSQMSIFESSWKEHGYAPLGEADSAYLKTTFKGFLLPVVLDALERRRG